jgi:carboxyl-terminal processing protease
MKNIFLIIGILFGLALCSCEDSLVNEPSLKKDPVSNFELLWQDFHDYYGLFEVKKIDWDSVYAVYRPQVHEGMAEEQFYTVTTSMLAILNDAHITLFPTNPALPRWSVDLENGISHQEDYSFDVVKENYLQSHNQAGQVFDWGWLSDSIGYIHVDHFMVKIADVDDAMKDIAPALKKAKGIVLDIRDAPGGQDPVGQQLAGYFASEKYLYMKTRKRSGPNLTDFTDWTSWWVEPLGGGELRGKPVVLLTTRFTGSGAETFSLAMLELPQVVQAGDTTAGAFSDNPSRQLYNGWIFSLSVGDFRDASGRSHEGKGLAPQLLWENKAEDVKAGKDEALEKAIQHLAE